MTNTTKPNTSMLDLSIEMWTWMAETGGSKSEWFGDIAKFPERPKNDCYLCDTYFNNVGFFSVCGDCPLSTGKRGKGSYCCHEFQRWWHHHYMNRSRSKRYMKYWANKLLTRLILYKQTHTD